MIDIEINNKGDFVSRNELKHPALKLSWIVNKTDALKLAFDIGRNMYDPPKNNGLKLSFKIKNKEDKKIYSIAKKENELRQRILVLLRTELGELINNQSLGTKIVQQKHRDILDESVLREVYNIVFNAVSGHLKNPSVKIRREKNETAFACQNLNVYIYDGKKEIYNFEMGDI